MILIDTSVMVDISRGNQTEMTGKLFEVSEMEVPFGISAYTYMEVLRGAKDELEYERTRRRLDAYKVYCLPESKERYGRVARMYFDLRRAGVTPRGTIDLMIAATAIEYNLYLLHDDRDFDLMASVFPKLKIWGEPPPWQ